MFHELGDLKVDEPLYGFLLTLENWNQAEIFEESLEVDVWRSASAMGPARVATLKEEVDRLEGRGAQLR